MKNTFPESLWLNPDFLQMTQLNSTQRVVTDAGVNTSLYLYDTNIYLRFRYYVDWSITSSSQVTLRDVKDDMQWFFGCQSKLLVVCL